MKFTFKNKPDKPSSKLSKVLVGLCIGTGVALTFSSLTDNETALLVSGGITGLISFVVA